MTSSDAVRLTVFLLEAAKRNGRPLGRPTAVTREQYDAIHRLRDEGKSHVVIGRTTGLKRGCGGQGVAGRDCLAREVRTEGMKVMGGMTAVRGGHRDCRSGGMER